jgi:hypothetical protein
MKYSSLKKTLADRYCDDIAGYVEGKPFSTAENVRMSKCDGEIF